MNKTLFVALLVFVFSVVSAEKIVFTGTGATFPNPLYTKVFGIYNRINDSVSVKYFPLNSGSGIDELTKNKSHFAASEVALTPYEKKSAGGIAEIPVCIGAVSISYNLNTEKKLKLTSAVIADIFLGRIKKWDDKKIKALNPEADLPHQEIVVIYRLGESGTSWIFSEYLSQNSPLWKKEMGKRRKIFLSDGLGASGNGGMGRFIKQIPGSIGYIQYSHSKQLGLSNALIKNGEGNYESPNPAGMRDAFLSGSARKGGYPLVSISYILVRKISAFLNNKKEASSFHDFLLWMTGEGQKYFGEVYYSPLPENLSEVARSEIKSIEYRGKQLNFY
ncbi:MAG: phosphate ABC transporter substrate-binding protein PstS [Fibrobacterota bacterium]